MTQLHGSFRSGVGIASLVEWRRTKVVRQICVRGS